MKSLFCFFVFSFVIVFSATANYTTPGIGGKYSLADLVSLSGGDVTFSLDAYQVNDTITISLNDTLDITNDVTVKFAVGTFFDINGTIIINPLNAVVFTAQNTTSGYLGMRLNASIGSMLKKLTFEYAVSLRLSDCSPTIDSCTFQYNNNNASTSFGNGSIALFRANPSITNSMFLHNKRAAIQGGANGNNAPKIMNCLFMNNNTTNQNVPQINLGSSGTDTVKITGNQILRASNRSGGIGFLPVGDLFAVVTGNVIKNNRYGITLNGGANIRSLISYNVIDSNNTEGNPNSGGSGISFSGGTATSHQASIVTGNYIRWNLWGITIPPTSTSGGAMPNLGNLMNSDTADDGKNRIYGNTNTTTPNIEFYNNNVDDIMAQGNYWGADDPAIIEARIFHKPDNSSLGLVNYSNYILPVELVVFNGMLTGNNVTLNWKTGFENNSDHFGIEKSGDGSHFSGIGKVTAAGYATTGQAYQFIDNNLSKGKLYYRLKLVDKNKMFKYSNIVVINPEKSTSTVNIYPTIFTGSQALTLRVESTNEQSFSIQMVSADGKLLQQFTRTLPAGTNTFSIYPDNSIARGIVHVRCIGKELTKTITLFKY